MFILAVDIFAMTNLNYINYQILIFYGVNNSVAALSNPILVLAGQLFAPRWARVSCELTDTIDDPPAILL